MDDWLGRMRKVLSDRRTDVTFFFVFFFFFFFLVVSAFRVPSVFLVALVILGITYDMQLAKIHISLHICTV